MPPEEAVECLAKLIASREDFSEDDIHDELVASGVPALEADLAFKFTQIAWGRVVLKDMGIKFSPDYWFLNAAGEVVDSGKIDDQPYFVCANRLSRTYEGSPGFVRLAFASADVDAVNNALNAGGEAENFVCAPAAVFIEPTTSAGLQRADQLIAQHLRSMVPKDSNAAPQGLPGLLHRLFKRGR